MALTKRIGLGVVLSCDPTGATTFAAMGSIIEGIDGADAKGAVVDTTLLGDKYVTKTVAQIDSGEVTFTIVYDPLDTSTTTILTGLLASSVTANWKITYPIIGGESQQLDTFYGPVSGFKRTIEKNKMITAQVTIAVSGEPGFVGVDDNTSGAQTDH